MKSTPLACCGLMLLLVACGESESTSHTSPSTATRSASPTVDAASALLRPGGPGTGQAAAPVSAVEDSQADPADQRLVQPITPAATGTGVEATHAAAQAAVQANIAAHEAMKEAAERAQDAAKAAAQAAQR